MLTFHVVSDYDMQNSRFHRMFTLNMRNKKPETPTGITEKTGWKKIIGVDPGTNILGYAVIEVFGKDHVRVLDCNILTLTKEPDHTSKLKEIFLQLQEIIETYLPEDMAIEAPFFGKNVQSMLKLGRAQGVAMAAGITMGLNISEYSPKKVKQSVTGNGNAAKEQVAQMLSTLLDISTDYMKLDATDALAVALCHFYQSQNAFSMPKGSNWAKFISENPDRVK